MSRYLRLSVLILLALAAFTLPILAGTRRPHPASAAAFRSDGAPCAHIGRAEYDQR